MNLFKKHLSLYGLFFVFCFGLKIQAAELNMKTEKTVQNNSLSAAFEMATFTFEGESVGGSGIKLDYGHHFEAPLEMNLSLFTAINGSSNQVSFSGLGGSLYYDVFGICCSSTTSTYLGSEKIIVEKTKPTNSLQVGIGLDQFYLNGSKSVYSSSGFNVGAAYKFTMFDYNLKAAARYSMMGTDKQKIQAYFLSLGIVFPL
jgi:hypothetical protein